MSSNRSGPEGTRALAFRVGAVLREIEAARSERVSPPVRDARARLVAAHGRARLAKRLEAEPQSA